MDKLTLPECQPFAIRSEVDLAPCSSNDDTAEESKIIDVALNDIKEETQNESTSDASLAFKNLLFELPLFKHNFSTKRKQEFLLTEQNEEKRKKIEENADLDNENSEDDEIEKVFNYLTGTYEPVAKCVKSESDENPKNQPETTSVQKQIYPCNQDAIKTDPVRGSSTYSVLSKSEAVTAPHLGGQALLSNNISFRIDDSPCTSPVISLDTHLIPLSESQRSCHDDSSNHALISGNSPPEGLAQIDYTTNVTIITASKNNSILENNNSLAEVNSSGSTLRELSIQVNPFPQSSSALSPNENRHLEPDQHANRSIPVSQEVPSPESNSLCHDDNSNHSVLSINSPADLSCIDDSSNDTDITTPENNLILENSTSSSVVKSSGFVLKELYISITPLPISNDCLSLSNGSVLEVDEENGNSDQSCSNVDNENYVDVTGSDASKTEKYFVRKLGRTLSLLHWHCKTCGFNAKTKENLISHIYNAHLKEDYEIKIKCKSCDVECDTPREMEQHELSHAISISDDNFALSIISSENSVLSEKSYLQNHIVSDCSDSSPTKYIKTRTNKAKIGIENNESEILELSDFDGDFPSKPKSIYRQCFFCKFATNRESNLKDHAEIHKGKIYYCEDHFWSSADSTCTKCTFENIMLNLNRKCDQQSITKKSNKRQKLQNTDQNINTTVENSSSLRNSIQLGENATVLKNSDQNKIDFDGKQTCSAPRAPISLLSVESAPDIETSLGGDSPKNPNVSHNISNSPDFSSIPNTGNKCNLDNYDIQNTESFNSKAIQDWDHQVPDTSKVSDILTENVYYVKNSINNKEEGILGENCSNVVEHTEKSSSSAKVIEPSSGPTLKNCVVNVADIEMPRLSVEVAPDTETSLGNASLKSPNVFDIEMPLLSVEVPPDTETSLGNVSPKSPNVSNEHGHSFTSNSGKVCNLDNYDGMTQNTENFNSKTIQDLDHQGISSDTSKETEITPTLKVSVIKSINNKEQEGTLGENCSHVIENTEKHSSSTKVIGPISDQTLESCVVNVVDIKMPLFSAEPAPDTETSLGNVSPKSPNVAHDISDEHGPRSISNTGKVCNLDSYDDMTQNTENCNSRTIQYLDHQVISSDNSKETEITPTLKVSVTKSINKEEGILGENCSHVIENTEKHSSSTKVIGPISDLTLESCVVNVVDIEMPLFSAEPAPDTETSLGNVSPKSPNVAHDISDEHGPRSISNTGKVCNLDSYDGMTQNTENCNRTIQYLDHQVISSDKSKETEITPTLKVSVTKSINKEEGILGENCSHVIENTEKHSSSTKLIGPISDQTLESCVVNVVDIEMPLLSAEAAPDTETSLGNVSPKSPNVAHDISDEHEPRSISNNGKVCNLDSYDGMTQNTENCNSRTIQYLDHQVISSDNSKETEITPTLKVSVTKSINKEEGILGENCSNVVENTEKHNSSTKVIGTISDPTLESCVVNVADIEMPLLSAEAAPDTETSLGNVSPKSPNVAHDISDEHGPRSISNTGKVCNLDNYDGMTQNTENFNSKTIQYLDHQVISSDNSKETEITPTLKVSVTKSSNNKESEEGILGENCSNVVENTEKHSSSTKSIGTISDPTLESCVVNVADIEMPLLSVEAVPDTETSLGNVSPKSPNVSHEISNEHGHSSTLNTGNGCNLDNYDGMIQNTENFNNKTIKDLDHQFISSDTSKQSVITPTLKVTVTKSINNKEQGVGILGENCSSVVENTEKQSSSTKGIGTISDSTLENCVTTVADAIETLENSVSTDTNYKKRKSCENLDGETIYLDESDSSAGDGFAITFKCFDCDTSISERDELKTHALSCHPNSSFKCNIHESKIGFHECAKCVYELLFRTFQTARLSIQDPFHVDWDLNRLSGNRQQMTTYKEPRVNERHYVDSDSDSDISWDSKPTEIRITRARAAKSKGITESKKETSQLSDHCDSDTDCDSGSDDSVIKTRPLRNKNNSKKIAKTILDKGHDTMELSVEKDNSKSSSRRTNYPRKCMQSLEDKFKPNGVVPCFDCNLFFTCNTFMIHVRRHMGSKYQCIRHRNCKSSNCQKCYYESALQGLSKRLTYCECGYVTACPSHLKRHRRVKNNCVKWKNRALRIGEMRCLVCSYRTNHKIFLKYHMVDHLDLTLCCKEHEGSDHNCELCLNEECLETAKKEVIICERCNFKTLLRQIFDGHACKGETVQNSNNNTIQIDKDRSTRNAKERTITSSKITDNQKSNCKIRSVPDIIEISETDTHPIEATVSENPSTSTTQNVNLKKDNGAKCFDCNAYFPDRSVRFSSHICYHIGSKYQCIKHQKDKPDDCQGCYYETALKDVLKIVNSCDDCGYKTIVPINLNKHKNRPKACGRWTRRSLRPKEMRCLTCQYVTKHKKFLKYHMVDHLDLTLSCGNKHDENHGSCELCLNEECLENAKKEVIICEKCNFKTLVKQVFDAHVCKEKTGQNADESTKTRACDSQDSLIENAKETTIPSSKITDSRRDRETVALIKAKCFDCKYSSEENDSTFKEHICRHIGSKYQCIEHWKNKVANCLKCLYEEVLQGLQTEVNTCTTCGYKTLNKLKFTKHLDDTESCSKWANRKLKSKRIRCLKCQYDTTHRKFLQYHMVDHLDVTFSCDVHQENKDEKCNKCIYEECLKNAKKEVKTCDKCNFKTAIKHIFNLHNCEEETTQNTLGTIGNNEGDETMIQPLGKKDKFSEETENTNHLEVNRLLDGDNAQSKTDLPMENIPDQIAILENKGNTQSLETTLTENMGTSTTENVESNKCDIKQRAQCFDCKFTCTDKVNSFFAHVCRHIGSKYQCIEHLIKPNMDCQKCHYESALKAVREKVQLCNRCGYKTTNNLKFSKHTERINSCDKWKNRSLREREMRCLQCQYVTTHKKFLKYHMVDHLNLTLSCDLHREKEDVTCATCLNVNSLENAKKEVKICEKCNFKTLIKQVFNLHDCKKEKSTIQDALFDRKAKDNNCKNIEDSPKEITDVSLTGIDSKKNSDVSQSVKENGIIVKSEIKTRCFDCKFVSDDTKAFEEHVCIHIGSKYQCVEHWRSNGKNCPKCNYEEVLQKLQIKIKACNICGYKTLDKLGMTRHLETFGSCSSWVNRPLQPDEIRCLQCQYVTTRKKFLKYHMVNHLDVTFSCDAHQDNKNDECEKCIYKECLESAKNEVQSCNKCDLKTVIKAIFDIHDCEGNKATEQQGVSSIDGTINLAERNDASSIDTNNIIESNSTQESSIAVNVKIDPVVKCFDCKYSCSVKRLFMFKKHIVRHVGSKFQCIEHTELKYMDCLKCYYEVTLMAVAEEIKRCPICGYTSIDAHKLNRHMSGIDSCKKWSERNLKSEQIRCFECQYMTTHKKFLKYHMVDHLDSKFVCEEHRQNKDTECLKCIYEESLEGAKKEAIICGKCQFKTVIKKVFKIHECKEENVKRETEDKVKTYTCLDCNEFTSHKKDELEKHAVVHYQSEFQCDEHILEKDLDNCSKCFYQNIIESVKKSVIVCEFCPFKACSGDVFGAHVCVNNTEDDDLTAAENESKTNMFICYHCDYRTNYRVSLKGHAVRHYGQKYECDDHPGVRGFNCRKCMYQHILKSYETCLKVCEKCNFKTLNNFDFDSHVNRNACSAVQAKGSTTIDNEAILFKCFDCEAAYQKEHSLKRHAAHHIGSTFKCNDHRGGDTDHNCRKCIYEDIVQNIESSTFTCSDCGFKAYSWSHSRSHKNNKVNCRLYRRRLMAEGKSLKLSQIETYKCFDCDFSHQRKDFLVKHITVHGRSTFQCTEHKKHDEGCAQCLYQDLLKKSAHWVKCFDCKPPALFTTRFSLKRHIIRTHIDSSYVCKRHDPKSEKCDQCQYECLVTQIIVQNQLACHDCVDKYFRTKKLLKNHIKECHLRSEFVCKVHLLEKKSDSCDMCGYEALVPICESEVASVQPVAGSSKVVSKYDQCFDCKFKTSVRSELTKHIRKKHANSDFSCSQHTMGSVEEETCPMCLYETVLVSLKQQLLICSKCKFEAASKDALDEHCKQNHRKGAVASDTVVVVDDTALVSKNLRGKKLTKFSCLDCGSFVTNSEVNLLRHLNRSSHAKYGIIEYNCKKHRMYDDACERCVFAKISKLAKKR